MSLFSLGGVLLFLSCSVQAIEIQVQNPLNYRVRKLTGQSLTTTEERLPERLRFSVPDRYVVRSQNGDIELEKTLERWRASTRGQEGDPLVHPGAIGDCSYLLGDKTGCDLYPFKNDAGEVRYLALRFMYRQGERTEPREQDYEFKEVSMPQAKPRQLRVRKAQPRFFELTPSGQPKEIKSGYNLFKNKTPSPFTDRVTGSGWMNGSEIGGIGGFVNYTEADASTGVTCSLPQNPLQCMICNCHHESGVTSEADKLAVGKVVMTRLGMKSYNPQGKRSVCDMIYKQKDQFTWMWDGKPEEVVRGQNFTRCLGVMKEALAFRGHFASHYHAHYVNPYWIKNRNCKGIAERTNGHTFYTLCDPNRKSAIIEKQERALGVQQ